MTIDPSLEVRLLEWLASQCHVAAVGRERDRRHTSSHLQEEEGDVSRYRTR